MDLQQKLEILTGAARYDVSCASSGSRRAATGGGLGAASVGGVCHSWSDDGRCISLLKILFSNVCIYDCAYCVNRCSNTVPRASFTVEEVVDLTVNFYRRNMIEGLFLSSGVLKSPDYTMERLVAVVRSLRENHRFGGYVHLKVIPGASPELLRQAALHADRVSVNIELPSEKSLQLLAPDKSRHSVLEPMKRLDDLIQENRVERKHHRKLPVLSPAGQSTQMIVGASPEKDGRILRLSEALYRKNHLKRVYYSAYIPVQGASVKIMSKRPELLREHRLYQADWLLRFYGFSANELADDDSVSLPLDIDPKAAWAMGHPNGFPVEVNRASYEGLLRVPGIGVTGARRIVASRRHCAIRVEHVKALGIVWKRARHFMTFSGKYYGYMGRNNAVVMSDLVAGQERLVHDLRQPSLFETDSVARGTTPLPRLQGLSGAEKENDAEFYIRRNVRWPPDRGGHG